MRGVTEVPEESEREREKGKGEGGEEQRRKRQEGGGTPIRPLRDHAACWNIPESNKRGHNKCTP